MSSKVGESTIWCGIWSTKFQHVPINGLRDHNFSIPTLHSFGCVRQSCRRHLPFILQCSVCGAWNWSRSNVVTQAIISNRFSSENRKHLFVRRIEPLSSPVILFILLFPQSKAHNISIKWLRWIRLYNLYIGEGIYDKRILEPKGRIGREKYRFWCADRSFEKYCPQQKHINYNNIAIKINTAADKRNYCGFWTRASSNGKKVVAVAATHVGTGNSYSNFYNGSIRQLYTLCMQHGAVWSWYLLDCRYDVGAFVSEILNGYEWHYVCSIGKRGQ